MTLRRLKLTIEYDGMGFCGWQRAGNHGSVQQTLEEAFEKFIGFLPHVYGAGRTDTGVHAVAQIAHVDIPTRFSLHTVQGAMNYHLQDYPVAITHVEEAPDAFHARFSAKARVYRYRICQRRAPLVLERERALHVYQPLDYEAMQKASQLLVGHHDFTSFRASECQAKSPTITLDYLKLWQEDHYIIMEVKARSFLHHMVRNLMGSLLMVGKGDWPIEKISEVLEAKDRRAAGPTAPPYGLYFYKVIY